MKNIKYLFVFVLLVSFFACNEYDENYRWKYKDSIILMDTSIYVQNVLIEDFTGQKCQNCPKAAVVIDSLQMQLNNDSVQRVVAVAIHGGLGNYIPEPTGLGTTQGVDYQSSFGNPPLPTGMINRKGGLKDVAEWNAQVTAALKNESEFGIEGHAYYNNDSLFIQIKALRNPNISQHSTSLKMGVWITEDSIKAVQKSGNGFIQEYVHKHVFRRSLTDMKGDAFNVNEVGRYDTLYACAFPSSPIWNKKQLHPVVFITNGSEVLQVISLHAEIIN